LVKRGAFGADDVAFFYARWGFLNKGIFQERLWVNVVAFPLALSYCPLRLFFQCQGSFHKQRTIGLLLHGLFLWAIVSTSHS